jgi:ferric-dicitrate binding protein FerR (iron transport regulator)
LLSPFFPHKRHTSQFIYTGEMICQWCLDRAAALAASSAASRAGPASLRRWRVQHDGHHSALARAQLRRGPHGIIASCSITTTAASTAAGAGAATQGKQQEKKRRERKEASGWICAAAAAVSFLPLPHALSLFCHFRAKKKRERERRRVGGLDKLV